LFARATGFGEKRVGGGFAKEKVADSSRKMQSDAGVGQRPDSPRGAQESSSDNCLKCGPMWNGICINHLDETLPNPNNLSRT
jgi:hypothetical protein